MNAGKKCEIKFDAKNYIFFSIKLNNINQNETK